MTSGLKQDTGEKDRNRRDEGSRWIKAHREKNRTPRWETGNHKKRKTERERENSQVLDEPADGKTGMDVRFEDGVGRMEGNGGRAVVHSLSCCLIGRGSVRQAELNLIRDVRHQLHFQANSQLDTAGGGAGPLSLLPALCMCVWLKSNWLRGVQTSVKVFLCFLETCKGAHVFVSRGSVEGCKGQQCMKG